MEIVRLQSIDIEILKTFLYEAIFVPEGAVPPPKDIVNKPELKIYYEGFGNGPADKAIAAMRSQSSRCAAWMLKMKMYSEPES